MSAIGPGDWVECVGRPGGPDEPASHCTIIGNPVRRGTIHCVREVGDYGARSALGRRYVDAGLRLVGTTAQTEHFTDAWWPAECFRPIYRPSADLIEGLLKPIEAPAEPEKVSA